ncbi:DMT family transporter [Sulfurospirillum arcachonense]|uniref:DMT family transporter n=1 Tax=Sulfurospirillum arcachonense TaxID=57666 RepID=UPI000468E25B|nr:DMT family transporter [Sulfurospirillum arcachonense]
MERKNIDWIAVGALCTAMMVWASSFIALKSAIGPLGPMTVIFGRMFIASLCFLYFIKSFMKLQFTRDDIKYMALMVIFEPCLYFIFEAKALQYTSAGQAGMITSMMPLITAIGAGIFLKEVITKKLLLGSFLAVSGAIWLSFAADGSVSATNPLLGNSLEFSAMICGAVYAITIRHLSSKFSALFLTAIQAFAGCLFFLPFALWEYNTMTMNFTIEALFWVAYLGVFVTLCGYGLFNYALGRVEASKASVYVNLIPVFAVILAYFALGEKLEFIEIVASCVILCGVFISQIPTEKLKRVRLRIKSKS